MKNDTLQSTLAAIAEQAAPSAEIDLWQGMQRHLATSESRFSKGDASMKTEFSRTLMLRRAALVLMTIAVAFAILFATPQGQAFAQSILQFFIRIEGNTIPATPVSETEEPKWVDVPGLLPATMTPVPTLTVVAGDCGDFSSPTCSVEQIRGKVDFTVKELGSIPKGLYFTGATGGADGILVRYDSDGQKNTSAQGNSLSILEERWTGQPTEGTSEVAASTVVEKAQIGNLPGEYYKGGFYQIGKQTVASWNPSLWVETLRWVDDGVSYTLKYSFGDGIYFGKKELIALAESMTTQPVAKLLPMPTPTQAEVTYDPSRYFNLSVPQAEQQAGFKVSLITRLPKMPIFIGARYDTDRKIVTVDYFFEDTGYSQISVILDQQVAPNPDDCWLCSFFVGDSEHPVELDPRMVPPSSNLQTVQIGGLTGQYVDGFWYKPAQECCYIREPQGGYRTLRWWKNGIAFELVNIGLLITKAEMITIAESIK